MMRLLCKTDVRGCDVLLMSLIVELIKGVLLGAVDSIPDQYSFITCWSGDGWAASFTPLTPP